MVQAFDTAAIESVMFVANVKGDPGTYTLNVDGAVLNLSRIDELKLCTGNNSTIELGTPFTVFGAGADITKLDGLLLVVKYNF